MRSLWKHISVWSMGTLCAFWLGGCSWKELGSVLLDTIVLPIMGKKP